MAKIKKKIKSIKIDLDKCNGCRACEVICSAFHANPKYSSNNPARSRIRLIREPIRDVYLPVYAGEYAAAECTGHLDAETAGKLGVGPESIGGSFKGAGKEVAEGSEEAGHEVTEGKPLAAGKEFGKGVGRAGEQVGKGVKKAVTLDSDRGDRENKEKK